MTRPYRPPNGTSGEFFCAQFCYRCQLFQKSGVSEDGCKIFFHTLIYDVDEDGYPEEWIQDDDGKNERCTAFEPIGW